MREAMDLIHNRVACITFELATPESVNFVTIINGADCSTSDLGMKGGEQQIYLRYGFMILMTMGVITMMTMRMTMRTMIKGKEQHIYLNSVCFDNGLLTLVDALLRTLGFMPQHSKPDRDKYVELALAYDCADLLTKKNLMDYVHRNWKLNSMRIDTLGTF